MNRPRILATGLAALFTLPGIVHAANRNWTGLGIPGDWNDPANWDTGVPTTLTGDNVFMHLTGTLTGVPITAESLRISVGTEAVPTSGFTFGAGVFNVNYIGVAEAHDGLNPTSNRFGRAFINSGTTINVGNFFVGEWDGGTGHVIQSGGDVNVSGQFRVGHWPQPGASDANAPSTYTMNGGTITVSGDPADPFNENLAGNVYLGIDSTGVLIVNNGVFTAKGIALDNRGATGGEDTLEVNGGLLNLGANGIASQNAGNPGTYEVKLGGGILRATASWSTSLETNLTSGGTGIIFDTNGNTITHSGAIIGAGGLTKIGTGTLVLSGANTFAGGISINGGTVQVGAGGTSGSLGSGLVTIGASGILSFQRTDTLAISGGITGAGQLSVVSGRLQVPSAAGTVNADVAATATLAAVGTLNNVTVAATGTIEAGIGGAGNLIVNSLALADSVVKLTVGTTSSKVTVNSAGGLVANGANTIQIALNNLAPGVYTLIDYAGTIGGAGAPSFSLVGLPSRAVGGLVHNTANTSLDLNITSIDFPKWTGATSAIWDGATQNWVLATGGTPTNYQAGDAVLFDDSATGFTTVDVSAAFSPSSVTFNNSTAKTYTLGGLGSIAGTTGLTKKGNGRVILATANTYTGVTDVQAGVLQVGDGITGSIGGTTVTVAAGAALELNVPAFGTFSAPTSGAGEVRTIGFNNFAIADNVLSGALALRIAGDIGQVITVGNQPLFTGPTVIATGTLRAGGATALGTGAAGTAVQAGATLDVNAFDMGAEEVRIIGSGVGGNGAIVNTGADAYMNVHKVVLTGNASVGGTARWDIRAGGIAGETLDLAGFKLTKVGGNQVSLVDVNSTNGDIEINAGTFSIENNSTVGGTGTITLNPGGTLGLWVNQPGKLTRNIVANGGAITELGSGAQTTVNSTVALLQDLTFNVNNGNTVYTQAGAVLEGGSAKNVTVNGAGRLVLTANNLWTGATNVNGILQVGNAGTTGTFGTGELNVNGTLVLARSDGFNLTQDLNAAAAAGTLILAGGGTVSLSSGTDIRVNQLHFGVNGLNDTIGGTLNIADGNIVSVQQAFIAGNSAGGGGPATGNINQTGGLLEVNAPNTDGRNFVLGHWPQGQSVYTQSGGVLNSPGISMAVSWDGTGAYQLSGGFANVLGLRFGHSAARTGVFNLTGGVLTLGGEGIWAENANNPTDINLGAGTIAAGAPLVPLRLPMELTGLGGPVTFDTNGNTFDMTGSFVGAGGFVKTGAGEMILNGGNSAVGPFVVNAGTVTALGAQTQNRVPDGATVQIKNGGTFQFGATNVTAFNANYIVEAGGTLIVGGGVEHIHVGTVNLLGGTWTTSPTAGQFDGENFFLHAGVTVGGTTPSLITQQGGNASDRGIGFAGTVTFNVGDVTGNAAADLVVSTELENDGAPGALVKTGSGTIDLSFANTYTGGTTISEGTVLVTNASGSGLGTGAVTVAAGARLGGSGTIGNAVDVLSVTVSGKLAPGNNSPGQLKLDLATGVLDLTTAIGPDASHAMEFELGGTVDSVKFLSGKLSIGAGTLEIDDFAFTVLPGLAIGTYTLFDGVSPIQGTLGAEVSGPLGGNFFGTLAFADGTNDLVLQVVPEPGATMALLGGLAVLASRRRRASGS